ncbi:unnamed protein product [Closterium sp. NIES-65]|nr:unnamed protein product [Closterium sp. NIES-65]
MPPIHAHPIPDHPHPTPHSGSSPSSHPIEVEGSKHKLTSKLGPYEVEGLKRKLTSKLGPSVSILPVPDWQVGECSAVWWRPNFETLMYPYCPPHITKPKLTLLHSLSLPSTPLHHSSPLSTPLPSTGDEEAGRGSSHRETSASKNLKLPFQLTPLDSLSLLSTPLDNSLLSTHLHSSPTGNEKLFVDPLTERLYFGVPKNLKVPFTPFSTPRHTSSFPFTPLDSSPFLISSSSLFTPLNPLSLPSPTSGNEEALCGSLHKAPEMKKLFVVPLTERQYFGEMKKLFVVPLTERQYFGVPKNLRPLIQLTPRHSPSLLSNPLHSSPPLFTPRHSSLQQEMKKLFVVPLTERQYFGVPKNLKLLAVPLLELYDNVQNLKLLAVPLLELYDNVQRYGPVISAIPLQLSRFTFNLIHDS